MPHGTWQTERPSASSPCAPQASELAPHEAGTTVRRRRAGFQVNTAPRRVWKAAVSPVGAHTSGPFVS
ncbi:MAG: hypothetical protein E6G42_02370, partial [Actinobacteria bacterium]